MVAASAATRAGRALAKTRARDARGAARVVMVARIVSRVECLARLRRCSLGHVDRGALVGRARGSDAKRGMAGQDAVGTLSLVRAAPGFNHKKISIVSDHRGHVALCKDVCFHFFWKLSGNFWFSSFVPASSRFFSRMLDSGTRA